MQGYYKHLLLFWVPNLPYLFKLNFKKNNKKMQNIKGYIFARFTVIKIKSKHLIFKRKNVHEIQFGITRKNNLRKTL